MAVALLHSPGGGWLSLDDPSETLIAHTPADVRPCLEAAETAGRRGAYAAGFVTYEAGAAFELATRAPERDGLPLAWFAVFPASHATYVPPPARTSGVPLTWTPSIDRNAYLAAIDRIKTHIADGDTYQLNFTFRLRSPYTGDPRALFDSLVTAQRGEWSVYLDIGSHAICSASPELFFRVEDGRIECRPMKGTMPRGLSSASDRASADRLHHSPKNRSENVMIVDLVRNDLGRVARVGSVEVVSLFDVERYPAQWQMTSTVTADVRGVSIAEMFAALFPSGSVTGAPKPRSMEIICDLETSPRGVYTGAIGLIEPSGRRFFNVAIRTVVIDRARREAEFGVGGGIVWESDAGNEFEECAVKAAILTNASPEFALLETLKWEPAKGYLLLDRHLDRLLASAAYFDIPCAREDIVVTLRSAVAGRIGAAKVRVLVAQDGHTRREVSDLPSRAGAWRVALAATPVSRGDVFLYHKTTNRAVYERARASRPDADAVLLWNEDDELTESVDANIVVEIDGRRVTPPTECGLLAGTMRAELLGRGEIVEGVVRKADLPRATRIWLINSVRGWMDAEIIGGSG